MTRPIRVEYPDATYHVMSHGVAGTTVFADDLDRRLFLEILREIVDIGRLTVHSHSLMTTHFHLLCDTPEAGLSRQMQHMLERYTRSFNRRHHRHGHLWQARYKAILVQDGEYFLHCSRYIHLNPVKAGLCARPEDYPWSSYRCYLGRQEDHGWVTTSKTLGSFASAADYTAFVLQGMEQDLRDPFKAAIGGVVFGSKSFAKQVRMLVRLPALQEDVPTTRELAPENVPSVEVIRMAVAEIFPELSQSQRLRMLMYAIRRFTNVSGREIATITGRSPSAVTHVWRDVQTRLVKDRWLRQKLESLEGLLVREAAKIS